MFGFIYAALALFALNGVFAAPSFLSKRDECMSSSVATALATGYGDLIGLPFNLTLANDILATTFTDYSDSVIELIDSGCNAPIPLGSATFNSSASFIAGQSSQAPIPFEILNIWPACTTVTFRWRSSTPGTVQPEQFVTGIIVIEAIPESSCDLEWQISTVYSEFNSGAWLYDLGVFVPNCTAPTKRSLPSIFAHARRQF